MLWSRSNDRWAGYRTSVLMCLVMVVSFLTSRHVFMLQMSSYTCIYFVGVLRRSYAFL
jgi:hypothetical protein